MWIDFKPGNMKLSTEIEEMNWIHNFISDERIICYFDSIGMYNIWECILWNISV